MARRATGARPRATDPTIEGKNWINDDPGLENEADVMGAKALQMKGDGEVIEKLLPSKAAQDLPPCNE